MRSEARNSSPAARRALRRLASRAYVLLLPVLAMALTGCSVKERYKRQVRWGYVFDIGGTKEITQWTLDQTEAERISDGHGALLDLTRLESGREARRAADGYLQVHRKLLDGWPDLRPSPMLPGKLRDREHLIYASRVETRKSTKFHPKNEAAQQLWTRLQELDPGAALEQPGQLKGTDN